MARIPIDLPPGLMLNGTEYSAKNRWRRAQLIRWRGRRPRPIGGWLKVPVTVANVAAPDGLAGVVRAMTTWRANNQQRWAAAGSTRKLYAFDGGTFTDITPSGFVVGTDDVAVGLGYGAWQYGKQAYGTARTASSITSEPGRWTLDTFGEQLVALANSDGRLHHWTFTGLAAPYTNAPTANRSFIVTNERHIMLLGAGDGPLAGGPGVYTANPRHVWWCSQEDPTDWDRTSIVNTAGDFNLDTPGQIMTAIRFAGDIYIFTDQDVHRCQYLGPPLIYGFHKLSYGCGIVGPTGVVETPSSLIWMGSNGFFTFDGYVRPLDCEVQDFLFGTNGGSGDLNRLQAAKVYAGHNVAFNEVWFYYPSAAGTGECDSYVIYNYAENHWTCGRLARTAWTDANVWPYPMATNAYRKVGDGLTYSFVYQHEQGFLDNNVPRLIWLESGPIEIGSGDARMVVDRVYQDFEPEILTDTSASPPVTFGQIGPPVPEPAFSITFRGRDAPTMTQRTYGPYTIDTDRGYTDCRLNERQVVLRVDQLVDGDWLFGTLRLNIKQGSGR